MSNIQAIRSAYTRFGKEIGKVTKKRLKDRFGMNWLNETSKLLNKKINDESDYDTLGPKEILNIMKRKIEIFENDIPEHSTDLNDLKNLKAWAYELLSLKNTLDHTNVDRVTTDDSLRILDDIRRIFNLFKSEVSESALKEIEIKYNRTLNKSHDQRVKKEKPEVKITDPRFKNTIENAQLDEYELQKVIESNYPEAFTADEITSKKVKFEINGFLVSLVLKKRENILEIVKGTIKRAYR